MPQKHARNLDGSTKAHSRPWSTKWSITISRPSRPTQADKIGEIEHGLLETNCDLSIQGHRLGRASLPSAPDQLAYEFNPFGQKTVVVEHVDRRCPRCG